MGFTIGGIREIRSGARRRGRSPECTAIAEFTGLWRWDVVPGARALSGTCSCGRPCRSPGAHPLDHTPRLPAGATLDEVTSLWTDLPEATVMLPVGHTFDIIEVAEPAGRRALSRLERMG
ncbi:MAG TPA: bifunctional DNA primase/polymerase, partial [Streptomyces sp.]